MTNTLQKGDLIGVAYNNYIWPAVYLTDECQSTAQFFLINDYRLEKLRHGRLIYKDYINRGKNHSNKYPIVKIDLNSLSDKDKVMYEETKILLHKNGQL